MNNPDEPLFDEEAFAEERRPADPALEERVRRLAETQQYAVLCLQGEGQPYGALVAFAFSSDLAHAVFATPMATRKHRLLSECDRVALVVDNRPDMADELMEIEGFTATGRAERVERGPEFERWAELLVGRHPYLASFVEAESCALYRVDVVRYLHVVRFQEVRQWIPTAAS